jgi:hypothetical protein
MIMIGWKLYLLWTAHTPCGVNSLRNSNQIKSSDEGRSDLRIEHSQSPQIPLYLLYIVPSDNGAFLLLKVTT